VPICPAPMTPTFLICIFVYCPLGKDETAYIAPKSWASAFRKCSK
jgi:hypothetical protein